MASVLTFLHSRYGLIEGREAALDQATRPLAGSMPRAVLSDLDRCELV